MAVISAYVDLFILGKSPGGNVRIASTTSFY